MAHSTSLAAAFFSTWALSCASGVGVHDPDAHDAADATDALPPEQCANFVPGANTAAGSLARAAGVPGGDLAVATQGGAFGGDAGVTVARLDDAGQPRWVKSFEGPIVWDVATDAAGEVAVVGEFDTALDVDAFHLTTTERAGYVLLFDASGTARFARALPRFSPTSVALDTDGLLAVAGYQLGGADLGAGPLAAGAGLAVARIDPSRTRTWSRDLAAAPMSSYNAAVLVEPDGHYVVAFSFADTLDLGTGPITSAGASDVAVARFDSTGRIQAVARFGGTADDAIAGYDGDLMRLARGPDGTLYVTTTARGDVDFGDGIHTVGMEDAALLALTPALMLAWSRTLGGDGFDAPGTVAVRDDGVIALTGTSQNASASGVFSCTGGIGVPLVLLDPAGRDLYSACFVGNFAAGLSVVFAPGRVQLAGFGGGSLDFGSGPLDPDAGTSLRGFIARFDEACR